MLFLELCIQMVYLSLCPLFFASLLFTAICKASSDGHFAFLHFFFLRTILIAASCIMSWTSYCQFRLKLKKVGKTTRPFRCGPNQIPYDYTVEVKNRFKELDLIDTSAWWTMDGGLWHCIGDRDQDNPQEKEMQKSKMAVWGGLTNSCEKKRSEKQRRKGKIYPFECRVPKNSKER